VSPRSSGAFPRGGSLAPFPSRKPTVSPRPSRDLPVIAVGRHVFVNCPGSLSGSVVLADESGKVLSTVHLADGVEVEVVAWRPRVAGEAYYRVRAPSSGADGWLAGANLRRALISLPAPEPPAVQAIPVAEADGKRIGQRSQPGQPASGSPTTAEPVPAPDAGGRRFGQRS
jgi:hypothetical protein